MDQLPEACAALSLVALCRDFAANVRRSQGNTAYVQSTLKPSNGGA